MKSLIPSGLFEARRQFASVSVKAGIDYEGLRRLPHREFLKAWFALAYEWPGFHPDSWQEWPKHLQPWASEAFRREGLGALKDDELYASDAAWCGLYDQMSTHTAEETQRRESLR